MYVKKAAIIPCKSFPIAYGLIDISDFEVILNTCNKTLKPPKPSNKAEITIVVEIDFVLIVTICESPFVSSTIPEIIGFI